MTHSPSHLLCNLLVASKAQAARTANVATIVAIGSQPLQRCVGCMQRCVDQPIVGNLLQERDGERVLEA